MNLVAQATAQSGQVLQAADRIFAESELSGSRRVLWHSRAWRPPTDLCETEDAIIARIEIAGMKEGNMTVSVSDRVLTVVGARPDLPPRGAYHQMEIQYGEFRTQVRLPAAVDEDRVEASYADGFLMVSMPKRRAQRIPVR